MRLIPLAILVLLAGCAAPLQSDPTTLATTAPPTTAGTTSAAPAQECPTHWHATFAVHVPGPNGTLERVDMATPRALNGKAYYDLSGGAGM
ncbi:MAG: hypothetical protein ABR586_09225, partial [Thermoplasmatota archaeon]